MVRSTWSSPEEATTVAGERSEVTDAAADDRASAAASVLGVTR
ncbi:hypothetical protein [Microbacterium hibisci]|nr:hypothetical protein [Microbacterium hibisci]